MRKILFLSIIIVLLKTGNVLSEINIFNVNNIEVSKNTYKNKDIQINEAFKIGYKELIQRLLLKEDYKKLSTSNLDQIKELISYYQIIDSIEEDQNNQTTKINIYFDKKKIHNFFFKRNILYSDIINSEIIIFPFLIMDNQNFIYSKNYFYKNWNQGKENSKELIKYILPAESIESIQKIKNLDDNIIDLDVIDFFKEYDFKNMVFTTIQIKDKNAKIFLNANIEGKKMNKNLIINRKNLSQEQFNKKIIFEIKDILVDLIKSQNLIDVRTPSFLNVELQLKNKKNNLVEFDNRVRKIDLIDSFFVQQLNKNYALVKIKYLGKVTKIIKKLKDQNMNLNKVGDNWKLSII